MQLYVRQDGPNFYHYSNPGAGDGQLVRIVSAPFRVGDFDLKAAEQARAWHDEWGYFKGKDLVTYIK